LTDFISFLKKKIIRSKVIRNLTKNTALNPEFGHTQGDIKKDLEKNTLAFKGRGKGG
jgi:hypothetical protein